MKAKLRRLKDVDLVIIDYLQLMSGQSASITACRRISEITRNLKIMAKEINVPVITLSQLSRASEQRTEHRPVLSDLRDSGSIEQDADIVLFLYRPDYYNTDDAPSDDKNSGECIVAKNRHGEAGPSSSTGRASLCALPLWRADAVITKVLRTIEDYQMLSPASQVVVGVSAAWIHGPASPSVGAAEALSALKVTAAHVNHCLRGRNRTG